MCVLFLYLIKKSFRKIEYALFINLVTFFIKIPEMAMANLAIIPYSLVESQII